MPLMLSERMARLAGASEAEIDLAKTTPQPVHPDWPPIFQTTWMVVQPIPKTR